MTIFSLRVVSIVILSSRWTDMKCESSARKRITIKIPETKDTTNQHWERTPTISSAFSLDHVVIVDLGVKIELFETFAKGATGDSWRVILFLPALSKL